MLTSYSEPKPYAFKVTTLDKYERSSGVIPQFRRAIAKSLANIEGSTDTSAHGDAVIVTLKVNENARWIHTLYSEGVYRAALKPINVKDKSDKQGFTAGYLSFTQDKLSKRKAEYEGKVYNLKDFEVIPYQPPIIHLWYLNGRAGGNKFSIVDVHLEHDKIIICAETTANENTLDTETGYIVLPKPDTKIISEETFNSCLTDKPNFLRSYYKIIRAIDKNYTYQPAKVFHDAKLKKPYTVLAKKNPEDYLFEPVVCDIDTHSIGTDFEIDSNAPMTFRYDTTSKEQTERFLALATPRTEKQFKRTSKGALTLGTITGYEAKMIRTIDDYASVRLLNHGFTYEHPHANMEVPYGTFPNISDSDFVTVIFPERFNLVLILQGPYIKAFYNIMEADQLYKFRQAKCWCGPPGVDFEEIEHKLRALLNHHNDRLGCSVFDYIRKLKHELYPDRKLKEELLKKIHDSSPVTKSKKSVTQTSLLSDRSTSSGEATSTGSLSSFWTQASPISGRQLINSDEENSLSQAATSASLTHAEQESKVQHSEISADSSSTSSSVSVVPHDTGDLPSTKASTTGIEQPDEDKSSHISEASADVQREDNQRCCRVNCRLF